MAWWQILVGILMFILALGVLIGIHELGHLGAAKLFNVYCFDYSIGFGPKLIGTKRSDKHETTWTLRAIPLGGFVSMYGEGMPNEEGVFIPPNRSLEGIARHKRAVVVSAGVILNFILGFILITMHNGFFPHYYFVFPDQVTEVTSSNVSINQESMECSFKDSLAAKGLTDGDCLKLTMDPFSGLFIVDDNAALKVNEQEYKYVLCMSNTVTTTKTDPSFTDSIVICKQKKLDKVEEEAVAAGYKDSRLISFMLANDINKTKEQAEQEIKDKTKEEKDTLYKTEIYKYYKYRGHDFAPDLSNPYVVDSNVKSISGALTFYHNETKSTHDVIFEYKNNKFVNPGIYLRRHSLRYNFAQTMQVSWQEWCGANTAVFRGLGSLFTGKGQLSGPIGIATMSTNILANFGFERYLYLWGMISCNLAILNLLPFPGLDGWALVVIAYEGITKKKIPTKVKGIVSIIGLGLLFLLMIGVFAMDIIRLIV